MQLLHWYAENADHSPGSVLDTDGGSRTSEPISPARARLLLIGTLAFRCPEKVRVVASLHKVKAGNGLYVGKTLPSKWHFRVVEVPVIEKRSVLMHWCVLWREECALKAVIRSTRSAAKLKECSDRLPVIQRHRERWEEGKAMYRGLVWFCGELELRVMEAGEGEEWRRWLAS
jgi:hypothetical protein